ncbi:glycosyltransferase family 2 protein [Candidatus Uhrbacteria bacterium]|nr:glycosyltransferase family 2 protein [Candidatus Uhrbacteria bacterium]
MISIIIPALNEGKVLPRTLDSIFAQSYKDIEVIYINDGSTDNTDEAIKPYLDRVAYIRHEKNLDKQVSRNEGLAIARGEYVFVCDADIVMRPDCLEKMFKALEDHPECSFAYSGFKWEWKTFKSFAFDIERLKKMNYINTASLVRRTDHPGFDPEIHKFQDWDVWLTVALRGRNGYYIPEILFSIGENLERAVRPGISKWLPRIAYKIPWKLFGIRQKAVEKYEEGRRAIKAKHHLL